MSAVVCLQYQASAASILAEVCEQHRVLAAAIVGPSRRAPIVVVGHRVKETLNPGIQRLRAIGADLECRRQHRGGLGPLGQEGVALVNQGVHPLPVRTVLVILPKFLVRLQQRPNVIGIARFQDVPQAGVARPRNDSHPIQGCFIHWYSM